MDEYQVINEHRHGLYDVPLHEVLISFNNDQDALAFIDWFEENRKNFEEFFDKYYNI
jgi:hypothetical protein